MIRRFCLGNLPPDWDQKRLPGPQTSTFGRNEDHRHCRPPRATISVPKEPAWRIRGLWVHEGQESPVGCWMILPSSCEKGFLWRIILRLANIGHKAQREVGKRFSLTGEQERNDLRTLQSIAISCLTRTCGVGEKGMKSRSPQERMKL
jgi:hypothetical protein